MATQPVIPESFAAIEAAADSALMSNFTALETPEPVVAPDTPVVEAATPTPPQASTPPVEAASTQAPVQATPESADVLRINLNDYPPETRKNVEDIFKKYPGVDPATAIGMATTKFWQDQRTLAAKEEAAQAAAPAAPPEAAPQPQLSATPEAEIERRMQTDPQVYNLKREYDGFSIEAQRLLGAATPAEVSIKRQTLENEISYIQRQLEEPYIRENAELTADLNGKLSARYQISSRLAGLDTNMLNLNLQFKERQNRISSEVNSAAYQRQQQQEVETRQAAERDAYAGRVEETWNATLPQVAKEVLGEAFAKDADLMAEYYELAKGRLLFKLEKKEVPTLPEVIQLLRESAQEKKNSIDRAHRFQSSLYKNQLPTNPVIPIVPTTVTAATPNTNTVPKTWQEIEESFDQQARENVKAFRG